MTQPTLRLLSLVFALALPAVEAGANCSPHPADVAPGTLGSELPTPIWTVIGNGSIDVSDVLVVLNAAVGNRILAWSPPVDPSCVPLPGDVSPGSQDNGFAPPRWTPEPNGVLDVGDVLVVLRFAVFQIQLDPDWLEPVVTDAGTGDRVVVGSVVDSVSAFGLPAVVVTAILEDEEVGRTQTDEAGDFFLQGLPSGPLTLRLDGSSSTAAGKFSTLDVLITVDTEATTSVRPLALADETDPAGATGKFTGDETGTVQDAIALASGSGTVGLATGPGGKILVDGQPADQEVDLSVVPMEGEDLPGRVASDTTGEPQNSTGAVAVGPASGKFTAGGAGLSGVAEAGFDLTLPNLRALPIDTVVDIWRWNGSGWTNLTETTGRSGIVIDLGGGMSAVFAAGVATDGGLYAAALPIDLFCASSLSGFVTDGSGAPLGGVFVGTSLGAAGFTDPFGFFFIPDVPAYSGVDLGDCLGIGYEIFVRGGVELGGASGGLTLEDFEVFPGSETFVGEIQLSVPDEGCLSGLVLKNGLPLSGPVAITGPEPSVLMADAQGRFAQTGMPPGSYRASFLFPGETIAREFTFDIVARVCAAIRLSVNEGAGTRDLIVEVLYDADGDLLTPNGPAVGAFVRVVGSDAVSSLGLEAVTGPSGRVVFEAVEPPYDVVAILDRSLDEASGSLSSPTGELPFMRIGAGLLTPAPQGHVTLPLRPPVGLGGSFDSPPGSMEGFVSNLPTLQADEFFSASGLRRRGFDDLSGGSVDPLTGQYYAPAHETPFDLAISRLKNDWPWLPQEVAFFGPFELPPPTGPDEPPILMENLDHAEGERLIFNQTLPLTHSNFFGTANDNYTFVSGSRMDGRSFSTLIDSVSGSSPFPSMVRVPDPADSDLNLALEFESIPDVELDGQSCIVPLRSPLPTSLNVDHLVAPDIDSPAGGIGGTPLPLDTIVNGQVEFNGAWNGSPDGFDTLSYESAPGEVLPSAPARTSFRRYLPAQVIGSGSLGPTPLPFVFPGVSVLVAVESTRGDVFPASHLDFFGPGLEAILQSAFQQADPICQSTTNKAYDIEPAVP